MAVPEYLTRDTLTIAARAGMITEEEKNDYWRKRKRFRCLSHTNKERTISTRTSQHNEARQQILDKLGRPGGVVAQERIERQRVENELASVKRQKAEIETALREKEQLQQALQLPHHAGNGP